MNACYRCAGSLADGYGTRNPVTGTEPVRICYDCCADYERESMHATGRAVLYLDEKRHTVTDWPGRLRFQVRGLTKGRHNIAGTRIDAWFKDDEGRTWHGVLYGEMTQLLHCKRLRAAR